MKECFCWQWVLTLSIVFIFNRLKRCLPLSEDGAALQTMLRPSETSSFYSGENNECVCPNTNSIIKEGYQIKIGQFITLVNIGKFLFSTSYRHWPLHCMTHAMKRLLHHPASRSKSITELRLLSSRNLCTEAVVATSPTWSYKFDLLLHGLVYLCTSLNLTDMVTLNKRKAICEMPRSKNWFCLHFLQSLWQCLFGFPHFFHVQKAPLK